MRQRRGRAERRWSCAGQCVRKASWPNWLAAPGGRRPGARPAASLRWPDRPGTMLAESCTGWADCWPDCGLLTGRDGAGTGGTQARRVDQPTGPAGEARASRNVEAKPRRCSRAASLVPYGRGVRGSSSARKRVRRHAVAVAWRGSRSLRPLPQWGQCGISTRRSSSDWRLRGGTFDGWRDSHLQATPGPAQKCPCPCRAKLGRGHRWPLGTVRK